jgi:hypothetical protein
MILHERRRVPRPDPPPPWTARHARLAALAAQVTALTERVAALEAACPPPVRDGAADSPVDPDYSIHAEERG